jgi:opacity protein-like surface antigen
MIFPTTRSTRAAWFARVAMLCGSAVIALPACADDAPGMFTLSGFGTLGMAHSSLETADYVGSSLQPNGAGATRRYDFENDSKLGVQLTARLTDKLSAVVQVISQHEYDNTFHPRLEWANVKYAFTPDFSVRVGRIEVPTFLNSEYRNVGYAFPWVRLPVEVYNAQPLTSSDGADMSYRIGKRGVSNTVRVAYGYSVFHVNPGMFRATGKNIISVDDTLEVGNFLGHVGYQHATVELPFVANVPVNVYSIAASYDPGSWFVQGELARVTVAQVTPGYVSGYVTGGVRVAKTTLFTTYAQSHGLGHATVIPNYNNGQRDLSVGARWDFMKNVDLKVQYDHVWVPDGSTGTFINQRYGYQLGSGANVFSAALDFVF